MTALEQLIQKTNNKLELASDDDQAHLLELANQMIALSESDWDTLLQKRQEFPDDVKLATYIAQSRKWALSNTKPVSVGIVFAMWGEHNRLRPRTDDNPTGEDNLVMKVEQLRWLAQNTPVEWKIYAVDDGDPYKSGELAEKIIQEQNLENVEVLRLDEALPSDSKPLSGLPSAQESFKGGAVIYGCLEAIKQGHDAIIYTDADNAVHLSQIGLLLQMYLEENANVVIGNRKHPDAMTIKQAARWGVGIKTLRHLQRSIGQYIFSRNILDTQAAFKLYDAKFLEKVLENAIVYDFSFDTDWLIISLKLGANLQQVPFAFVDSFEESATIKQGATKTWHLLLQGLAKQVQTHEVQHNQELADFVLNELTAPDCLDPLLPELPKALDVDEALLGKDGLVPNTEIMNWIRQRL